MSVGSGCGLILATSWAPSHEPGPTPAVASDPAATSLRREWHVTAIASNCSIFLKMKAGMKSSMAIVSFTPEGDLAMKLPRAAVGCLMSNLHVHCFTLALPWGPAAAPQYLDPQCGAGCWDSLHSPVPTLGVAAAREQDVSPQLLQKFMELIPTMGLTEDMLAILPSQSSACPASAAEGPCVLQT
uniref:Uncharacterized protein n=1 Tax=Serinus canaria TaxID=9135 RepID=A0A8C9N9S4_SERCA